MARAWLVPAGVVVALALLPAVLTPYTQDLALKIAVYAVFALSLQLLVGRTGLVSLGHAAFLGIGAYAAVLLGGDGSAPAPGLAAWAALAVLAAAGCALLVGALSLRTRGVYFIMVTLAFAQMAYFIVHDTRLAGGSDGLFMMAQPMLTLPGSGAIDLTDRRALYHLALVCLVGTYALLALIGRSRFGHALDGIRVNEQRMRAAGFATYRYQLAAFVIAGALAGLAGFLLALKDGAVNPELLSWHESGAVLLMVILGGSASLRGAVMGAAAFTLLKELCQSEALLGPLASHWQLTLGLCIIAFVAGLPRGLIGLGGLGTLGALGGLGTRRGTPRPARRPEVAASRAASARAASDMAQGPTAPSPPRRGRMAEPLLQARVLTRHFGGVHAVDAVSLDLRVGELHAVIGTNGAGKSTLINLLSGELVPSSGQVWLDGVDITGWSQARRARAGIGRCYQRSTLFPELSVLENCRLCAQARTPRPWALWQAASSDRVSLDAARAALAASGLEGDLQRPAHTLSHGAQRQLEIAMCLSTAPRVLLLDEPLAGMGAHETAGLLALFGRLKQQHAVLLIEHDMDAVFRVADRVTVMVDGAVIASDGPERVRADPAVQRAYLGEATT